ncbi:class I SAM-dependent methyltransferase [Nocardia sp. NEAU-G5]|uniref:Class I SAM-dependent methyltransferase n=1 Tax=Nocardia albiluteola TaxID=2842303 RepID=A0ABS6B7W3_9NOCA|nr:cyclopropane mycolic acid synthase family methyltransferase [Nocardia albiluteola]MBU3066382.1 class I SAM-dependent methyltransferase [Nocardia albiluteola]
MTRLAPFYRNVQSHYDVSDDFYRLFLDPSMTYSCAYFERPDMSLEQAQLAKIDLSLGKLDLHAGQTLLDVGCGWGATMFRAAARYDVHVTGLTLSRNQFDHVRSEIERRGLTGVEVRLQGWEEFHEPVDRIVSIGAFEHFRRERYEEFFDSCYRNLPEDGRMLLHTIIGHTLADLHRLGIPVTREDARFHIFIRREIFPGGQLPQPAVITRLAGQAGFGTEQIQSLQSHYARTLDLWASALRENRSEAERITSPENYERYLRYLTGSADHFRSGHIDVMQFTLAK